LLYGDTHPYGYNSTLESIDILTRDDIIDHYTTNYVGSNAFAVVSGDLPPNCQLLLNTYLGAIKRGEAPEIHLPPIANESTGILEIEGVNKLQSSIRIGKR